MTRDDFLSMCHNYPIKHERMRDVAFLVLSVDENANSYKLRGHWINIIAKPQCLIGGEEITIKKKDIDNWEAYYETTIG